MVLNSEQQEAVMRSICAKDYALLLGMPGTGKTTTISAIVKALVALGKKVGASCLFHKLTWACVLCSQHGLSILSRATLVSAKAVMVSCCNDVERHVSDCSLFLSMSLALVPPAAPGASTCYLPRLCCVMRIPGTDHFLHQQRCRQCTGQTSWHWGTFQKNLRQRSQASAGGCGKRAEFRGLCDNG